MIYSEFIKINRKRQYEQRKYISNLKEITGCEICGRRVKPSTLTFHHIDKKRKRRNISCLRYYYTLWKPLLKEIKKCIIVCEDCHRDIHKNFEYLC